MFLHRNLCSHLLWIEHQVRLTKGEEMNSLAIRAAIIAAPGFAAFVTILPDIKRYMKMRSMYSQAICV
jgi:hypothetical protein